MKVIIIEEHRFKAFIDMMRLKADQRIADRANPDQKLAMEEIHRLWHYEFVHWAQKEGASCT